MEQQFESIFKEELTSMENRLTDMEEKINSIDTKLTQVVDAILGNPLTKTGGFINDIEHLKEDIASLKKRVEKQEDFKKRVYWGVGIIVAIALLVKYITEISSSIKP